MHEPGFGRIVCLLGSLILWSHVCRVSSHTLYQWILDSKTRFNYDPDPRNNLGVYNWPRTYPDECSGLHQSPVDIQTNNVRYGSRCSCPTMLYESNIIKGKFINNGHSAEFEPEVPTLLRLSDVPYRPGIYLMHDVHLHYGGVQGRGRELQGMRFRGSGIMSAGSEHTVDGLRFEGELHFAFYNSKYRNMEEADNKKDGVAVLVILVQKIPDFTDMSMETLKFSDFLGNYIPQIAPYQQNVSVDLDMSMFFNRACEFYTYAGSITTPMCHESVRWIILREPIHVTERAWFQLTKLVSRGDFNARFGNYRTTQPLNDRVIEANFPRPAFIPQPVPNGDARINPERADLPMMTSRRNELVPGMNGNAAFAAPRAGSISIGRMQLPAPFIQPDFRLPSPRMQLQPPVKILKPTNTPNFKMSGRPLGFNPGTKLIQGTHPMMKPIISVSRGININVMNPVVWFLPHNSGRRWKPSPMEAYKRHWLMKKTMG